MPSERALFLRHVAQTSESPMLIEVARAEGVYLYAPDGKPYLDLISGIAVANVGHCAPPVVQAVQEQAARYMHTMVYGEYVLSPQVKFAAALAAALGPRLDITYFVNSGAEAVEGALKLSKKYTGRQRIIAYHNSYHGSTHGALSVTGSPTLKAGYGPFLPQVTHIEFNQLADLEQIDSETACVIVEPIRGEAGIQLPAPGYLQALRQRCDQTGTLLIFDEIQTGFGRTGAMFAHQLLDIRPDILLLAKGMGGGMPIGAFISRAEIMQVLTHDPVLGHISTFGGHPVSCAAGLAALKMIQEEKLLDGIPEKAKLIQALAAVPGVLEVRGLGLMWAVEVGSFEKVLAIIAHCVEKGLITDWFLHCNTAIRIAPPLVITLQELETGLSILAQAIQSECTAS